MAKEAVVTLAIPNQVSNLISLWREPHLGSDPCKSEPSSVLFIVTRNERYRSVLVLTSLGSLGWTYEPWLQELS